jgi:hypothetical protein
MYLLIIKSSIPGEIGKIEVSTHKDHIFYWIDISPEMEGYIEDFDKGYQWSLPIEDVIECSSLEEAKRLRCLI